MESLETKETNLILFVGEGDFSFSACYSQTSESREEHVFASCLCLGTLSSTQENNIKIIQHNGGSVFTDVDATKIENHPVIGNMQFSKVTFNFPHITQKMNIKKNRKLVELFFKSAEKVLKEHGKIIVTLCRGQGGTDGDIKREWANTWQVTSLAANSGLLLCDLEPFIASQFTKYECTGFRGLFKPFHMEGAVTHIFCRGQPAHYDSQKNQCEDLLKWFIQDSRNIYELTSQKLDTAFTRVVLQLHHIAESIFSPMETIFVAELSICQNLDSPTEDKLMTSYICYSCVHHILSLFLDNHQDKSSKVSSVICTLSCSSVISVSSPPFHHFLTYFCSSEALLIDSLVSLLNSLTEPVATHESSSFSWFDTKHICHTFVINSECATTFKKVQIKDINPIFAIYSVKKSNGYIFYTDVEIILSTEKHSKQCDDKKFFEIGYIVKFMNNSQYYTAAILNLDVIATLRYHVADCRIVLLEKSYFTFKMCEGSPSIIHRSPSLFPPSYKHDTSFWIGGKFNEQHLFLLVRKIVGSIIDSVKLVDLYKDELTNRESRCYRFEYKSFDKVVSQKTAANIHSRFVRKAIEYSLKVQLR